MSLPCRERPTLRRQPPHEPSGAQDESAATGWSWSTGQCYQFVPVQSRRRKCSRLLGDFCPLQLVDHFVGLPDARLRQLLSSVFTTERLQFSEWHLRVYINVRSV